MTTTADTNPDARPRVPEHVVILGAGPAGLAAGHELATRGVRVTVLERAPWVGGLSITWEQDGFRFDIGGHRWFTKKDWLHNWFLRLMEGELVTVHRTSRIYFGGKYIDYPVKIGNVFRTTGIVTSIHAALSYAFTQVMAFVRPRKVETIEQAYIAQFGTKLYQMFFKRYTEKVWGRDCSLLSADWVAQRTKGLSVWQTLQNAIVPIKSRPGAEKIESLVDTFVYPRFGYQRISERMRDVIEANGGTVMLESTVTEVESQEEGVVIRYRDKDGDTQEIACEHAISTIRSLFANGGGRLSPPQRIFNRPLPFQPASISICHVAGAPCIRVAFDSSINFANFCPSVVVSLGTTQTWVPLVNGNHNSGTAISHEILVADNKQSLGENPISDWYALRKLYKASWEIPTPLGCPVEPEV